MSTENTAREQQLADKLTTANMEISELRRQLEVADYAAKRLLEKQQTTEALLLSQDRFLHEIKQTIKTELSKGRRK